MSVELYIKHHNNILKDAKESIEEAIMCVKHAKDYRWEESPYPYDAIVGQCEIAIQRINELCGEEEAPEPIEPTFIDLDERVKEKEEE